MELSINLTNSSESSLASQQQFLRNLPLNANIDDLSLDTLRLLVYYLMKQGPYELASLKGFEGTLEEWLNSLRTNLNLKAYVQTYAELSSLKDLKEGDLVYVKETSKVYLYSLKKFQEKEDGLDLTGASAYDTAKELGFEGTPQEWLLSLKGDSFVFEDFTGEELELLRGDKGLSAYEVAVNQGFVGSEKAWLATLKGVAGAQGVKGDTGSNGVDGSSAYTLAVQQGFEGTIQEFVESLKGETGTEGASAYTIALNNGYQGSEENFLESLKGLSAYELDLLEGYEGTLSEWISSLKGKSAYATAVLNGFEGSEESFLKSLNGLSAYELATQQGYVGTLTDWLEDLKAESPYQTARKHGFKGTEEEWVDSLKGYSAYSLALKNGYEKSLKTWLQSLRGMSAYEIAVGEGYKGTPREWLKSLQGSSAYTLAVSKGFEGTLDEYLASLKGERGLSAYEEDISLGFKGTFEQWRETLRGKSPYELAKENGYTGTEKEWIEEVSTIKTSVIKVQTYLEETKTLQVVLQTLLQSSKTLQEDIERTYVNIVKSESNVSLDKKYVNNLLEQFQDYFKQLDNKLNATTLLLRDTNVTVFNANTLLAKAEAVLEFTSALKNRVSVLEGSMLTLPSFQEEVRNDILGFNERLIKSDVLYQTALADVTQVTKDFKELVETLPFLLKSYEYIVTDTGTTLKEYLTKSFDETTSFMTLQKTLNSTFETVLEEQTVFNTDISSKIAKKIETINGKAGFDITLVRKDIADFPTDTQIAQQVKEDQYVVTASGKTQREKNLECISLHDYCLLDNTDETTNFLKAIEDARSANKKLVAHSGTVKISQDINLRLLNFDLSGLTIRCKDSSKVIVGWDAGTAVSKTVYLGTVYNDAGFKLLPSQITVPSVYMLGSKDYNLHWVAIDRMDLYVSSDPTTYPRDASIAYCNFYGGLLVYHEYVTDPRYAAGEQADGAGSANQWINSNMWHVSRMMGVKIAGSYRHNGNIYHNPTFENDTSFIYIEKGNKNHFLNIRGENYPQVSFGEETTGNIVQRCWYSATSNINSFPNYTDKGRQNKYTSSHVEMAEVIDLVNIEANTSILFNKHVGNYGGRSVTHKALLGRSAGSVIYQTNTFNVDARDIIYATCDSKDATKSQYAIRIYLYDENGDLILDADDSWRSGANFNNSFLSSGFFLGSFNSEGQTWFNLLGDGLTRVKKMSVMILHSSSGVSNSSRIRVTMSTWRSKYSLINTDVKPIFYYNFVSEKPTECIAPIGTRISNIDGTSYFVAFSLKTKVSEATSTSSIRCAVTTLSGVNSLKLSDLIGIDLVDGTTHWTTISGISSGLITLATAAPSTITVGDTVYFARLV